MPNPNELSPGAVGTRVDLSSAPGAEINFDDLFPVDPANLSAPQVPQGTPTEPPQAPADNWFLKTDDGKIVYRTQEDAIQGIAHKDALVDRYRTYLKSQGIDPDSLQNARTAPEPQAPSAPQPGYKYFQNGKNLYKDLSEAVTKNDPDAYERTMRTYQMEVLQNEIAPVVPLLTEVARNRAVRKVSTEVPEFETYLRSDDYRQSVERLPILKEAINNAENNFAMADKLDQLYQLAYLVSQGMKKNTAPAPVAAPVQTQPVQRPTTTSSTLAPPQPSVSTQNWASDSNARRQLIKDFEARGIKDVQFPIEGDFRR